MPAKGDSTLESVVAEATLEIDGGIHSREAILRAGYKFTDRAFLSIARDAVDPEIVRVTFRAKDGGFDPRTLVGPFGNELIDQGIRCALEREVGPLRELIVAQAFAEGNLLDPDREDGDFDADPLGIGSAF